MDEAERSQAAARHRWLTELVEGPVWRYVHGLGVSRCSELTATCTSPLTEAGEWHKARGGLDALRRLLQAPHVEMDELEHRLEEES